MEMLNESNVSELENLINITQQDINLSRVIKNVDESQQEKKISGKGIKHSLSKGLAYQ